eukprot:COSAG01_NODE_1570_length_9869_cov_360.007267_12_plen_58_part_00
MVHYVLEKRLHPCPRLLKMQWRMSRCYASTSAMAGTKEALQGMNYGLLLGLSRQRGQ